MVLSQLRPTTSAPLSAFVTQHGPQGHQRIRGTAPLISNLGSSDKLGIRGSPQVLQSLAVSSGFPRGWQGEHPLPRAAPTLLLLVPGSSRSSRRRLLSKNPQASAPPKKLSFSWRFYRPQWIQNAQGSAKGSCKWPGVLRAS